MLISINIFCKFRLSFLRGLARHVKSTETTLQYFCKKNIFFAISQEKRHVKVCDILIFGMCIDLKAIRIISFICQSRTIAN